MNEWEKEMLEKISEFHTVNGYNFHRNLLNLMRHEIKIAIKEISVRTTKDGWVYTLCIKLLAKRGIECE